MKKEKKKKYGKENSSRPFLAQPAGGQETTFYLRVASGKIIFHSTVPKLKLQDYTSQYQNFLNFLITVSNHDLYC